MEEIYGRIKSEVQPGDESKDGWTFNDKMESELKGKMLRLALYKSQNGVSYYYLLDYLLESAFSRNWGLSVEWIELLEPNEIENQFKDQKLDLLRKNLVL